MVLDTGTVEHNKSQQHTQSEKNGCSYIKNISCPATTNIEWEEKLHRMFSKINHSRVNMHWCKIDSDKINMLCGRETNNNDNIYATTTNIPINSAIQSICACLLRLCNLFMKISVHMQKVFFFGGKMSLMEQ